MSVTTTLTGVWGSKVETIDYGLLYNGYVVLDPRGLANIGWRVPTYNDFLTLRTTIGGISFGGALKEVSSVYWTSPNIDANNSTGFTARGGGMRIHSTGAFDYLTEFGLFRSATIFAASYTYFSQLAYDNGTYYIAGLHNNAGTSIRLIKESTTLLNGETGYYIGNDGKVYTTICIGTQEWMSQNLAEMKYTNSEDIPEVTDAGTWAALVTGALCVYNNDWENL